MTEPEAVNRVSGTRAVTGMDQWRALVGRVVEFVTTDGWDDYIWRDRIESVTETRTEYDMPRLSVTFVEGGGILVEPGRTYDVTVHGELLWNT